MKMPGLPSRAGSAALFAALALFALAPARVCGQAAAVVHLPPPQRAEQTQFVVEVNKMGQVTRVRTGKYSSDPAFNAITYGNALQVFIRTPQGRAVSGTYRLMYDYDPKSRNVRRTVSLIHAGGVDPNAIGAVNAMAQLNRRRAQQGLHPTPAGTLPDLRTITGIKH